MHMWTQIVGKIRLALTPWLNHSWHVALYLSARGLTTGPIAQGARTFELEFDFVSHLIRFRSSESADGTIPLRGHSVASLYREIMRGLVAIGITVQISDIPAEVADGIPFQNDKTHIEYEKDHAHRLWRALGQSDRVFKIFRARFIGKCSPVHFFWGSFDLAVTRFSGRAAPPHPGGVPHLPLAVAREAYSHEVSSAGFWPGNAAMPEPIFYSYAYPTPDGFAEALVRPEAARWHPTLREFVLPYEAVRTAADPDATLLEFLQSSYETAANLSGWDREALEHRGEWPR